LEKYQDLNISKD